METTPIMPDWKETADRIWATLDRIAQNHAEAEAESKKRHAEAEAQSKKWQAEAEKRHAEAEARQAEAEKCAAELRQQMKRTDSQLSKLLGNGFGDMIEHMVIPNLLSGFEELGFTFTKANRTEIKDREHDIFAEIDAFLENGEKVMAVEIKSKPNIEDIEEHIERMEKLRRYADLHHDRRTYLGAIAGVVFSDSEKTYALKKGFYVIEPSGDTFRIIEPKGKYHPHEW